MGLADMGGYGYVTCSCGWDSDSDVGWVEHIEKMMSAVGSAVATEPEA